MKVYFRSAANPPERGEGGDEQKRLLYGQRTGAPVHAGEPGPGCQGGGHSGHQARAVDGKPPSLAEPGEIPAPGLHCGFLSAVSSLWCGDLRIKADL